ncbi:MAG TPA: methyltransferase domain-containing protein [Rubrivivax sp.]
MKPRTPAEAPQRDTPDRDAALAQYRRRAAYYDLELAALAPLRRRAIEALGLRTGETVLDVGCGTGLSLPLLVSALGPSGRIVGIEQSASMLAHAQRRVAAGAWQENVRLECAPAEEAKIGVTADAALFFFTHDILRRPEALGAVLSHLRPGARVVAAGLKWAPPWAWPVNLFVWPAALHSVSSLAGLEAPWSGLAQRLDRLDVESWFMGGAFVATGSVAGPLRRSACPKSN